ncbi:MAG: hypothetical protein ACMUEL_07155 [Flavobacteriales bacterium Tduv]
MCFSIGDQIPDHTALCRFHNEIVAKKAYESLLKKINKELVKPQVIAKIGVIVGSIIRVSLLAPKESSYPYVVEDRKKEEEKKISQRK